MSIPAFEELLQNYSEELDLGNLFSSSLMYAMDLSKVGKNKEAAELLTSILDATRQYLDSANVAVIQNQLDLYTALSAYNPYTLSFQGETASVDRSRMAETIRSVHVRQTTEPEGISRLVALRQ